MEGDEAKKSKKIESKEEPDAQGPVISQAQRNVGYDFRADEANEGPEIRPSIPGGLLDPDAMVSIDPDEVD